MKKLRTKTNCTMQIALMCLCGSAIAGQIDNIRKCDFASIGDDKSTLIANLKAAEFQYKSFKRDQIFGDRNKELPNDQFKLLLETFSEEVVLGAVNTSTTSGLYFEFGIGNDRISYKLCKILVFP